MKLKKIYIEITNRCNLNCSFCIRNDRKILDISRDNYEYIINNIKEYTKEVYLHVLGEPLLHRDINYFIDYANRNGLLVNITTNGYLINNIKDNYNIHRLNISMHSFNDSYNKDIDSYLNDIFNVINNIKDKTFISLRLWVKSKYSEYIINYINKLYNTNIILEDNSKIKVCSNLIIDTFHEFIWPDLNNNYYNSNGTCMGLIDHIGILSDGRIIPCCLDSKGIITLGNIYNDKLIDVMNKDIVKEMKDGFKKNYKCQELCRHCSFLGGKNEGTRLEK